jgi:hypothetical protein
MIEKAFRRARETRRFTICEAPNSGWEVREERDTATVRRIVYHDWHRVERAIAEFRDLEAGLRADGWIDVRT